MVSVSLSSRSSSCLIDVVMVGSSSVVDEVLMSASPSLGVVLSFSISQQETNKLVICKTRRQLRITYHLQVFLVYLKRHLPTCLQGLVVGCEYGSSLMAYVC